MNHYKLPIEDAFIAGGLIVVGVYLLASSHQSGLNVEGFVRVVIGSIALLGGLELRFGRRAK